MESKSYLDSLKTYSQAHVCRHGVKVIYVWLGLLIIVMIAGIDLSQGVFAIDMSTALNPLSNIVTNMLRDCYDHMQTRLKAV